MVNVTIMNESKYEGCKKVMHIFIFLLLILLCMLFLKKRRGWFFEVDTLLFVFSFVLLFLSFSLLFSFMENSKQGTGVDSYVVYDMQHLGHPSIIGEHDLISSIVTNISKQTNVQISSHSDRVSELNNFEQALARRIKELNPLIANYTLDLSLATTIRIRDEYIGRIDETVLLTNESVGSDSDAYSGIPIEFLLFDDKTFSTLFEAYGINLDALAQNEFVYVYQGDTPGNVYDPIDSGEEKFSVDLAYHSHSDWQKRNVENDFDLPDYYLDPTNLLDYDNPNNLSEEYFASFPINLNSDFIFRKDKLPPLYDPINLSALQSSVRTNLGDSIYQSIYELPVNGLTTFYSSNSRSDEQFSPGFVAPNLFVGRLSSLSSIALPVEWQVMHTRFSGHFQELGAMNYSSIIDVSAPYNAFSESSDSLILSLWNTSIENAGVTVYAGPTFLYTPSDTLTFSLERSLAANNALSRFGGYFLFFIFLSTFVVIYYSVRERKVLNYQSRLKSNGSQIALYSDALFKTFLLTLIAVFLGIVLGSLLFFFSNFNFSSLFPYLNNSLFQEIIVIYGLLSFSLLFSLDCFLIYKVNNDLRKSRNKKRKLLNTRQVIPDLDPFHKRSK